MRNINQERNSKTVTHSYGVDGTSIADLGIPGQKNALSVADMDAISAAQSANAAMYETQNPAIVVETRTLADYKLTREEEINNPVSAKEEVR